MHKQNPLDIKLYKEGIARIDNIPWSINSIAHEYNFKGRFINYERYGIHLWYI